MAINIGKNTDGDVTYENPPVNRVLFPNITEYATPEAIEAFVNAWLDDHPEATTTVEDGSILPVKLDSTNSPSDGYILSYNATAGKFEWVDIDSELDDINTEISDLKQELCYYGYVPLNWEQGGLYSNNGLEYDSPNVIRTGFISVTALQSMTIINPNEQRYGVAMYGSTYTYNGRLVADNTSLGRTVKFPEGTAYIRFQISKTPITPSEASGFYAEILDSNSRGILSGNYLWAVKIPSNSNFNDYTTPGNYLVETVAVASTITNIPVNNGGRLTVITTASALTIFHLYITTSGYIYSRCFTSGAWTEWTKLLNKEDADKMLGLAFNSSTLITANSDFNDYTTPGTFRIVNFATANTISNIPVKNSGRLVVFTLAGTDFVHQWYISASNIWYIRELINGIWSAWKQFAYVNDISAVDVDSASKGAYNVLQTLIADASYNIAFANAFVPLTLQNYVFNTENVHPKVLYFANGFSGHKFWMAYTPYPKSQDVYENPCIAYSEDGYQWTNISDNPIDAPTDGGYNSDTHLVYNSANSTLECWYRYVGPESQSPREETIYRQISSDGITWGDKELVHSNVSGDYADFLSPAVFIEGSKYCIWVVNNSTQGIDYYEAPVSDITDWTKIRTLSFTITDDDISVKPWHLDVIKDDSNYVLLLMCRNGTGLTNNICSLFISTSADNITYSTPVRVVKGAENWDRYMYRSSIVKVGTKYRIYYSASSGGSTSIYNNARWGIGITESDVLTSGYIGKYE